MISIRSILSIINMPVIIAVGAIFLFVIGYVSHAMFGANNVVEQVSEELLKKEYNIDVEFSEK
jgi:hypothetical protein